ncbi:MAG TPA: hypothetical protein VGJ69_14035 [Pyrinomonadaceae bacterium]
MEPKRSKYDTNPLDEQVADDAETEWGRHTAPHQNPPTETVSGSATRDIGRTANEAARSHPETEAPTRRIDDTYPSVFAYGQPRGVTYQPPQMPVANIYQPPPVPPPQIYQPPPIPVIAARPGSNKVAGLGIPERWAVMLPYLPVWPAIVIAIVELVLVPRTETRTRFHASQALVVQIGVTALSMLLTFGSLFTERFTGAGLFNIATTILLIIAMVRVWKGKPLALTPLDEPRKWLDEKIKPRK